MMQLKTTKIFLKLLAFHVLFLSTAALAWAQNITITGKVTDAENGDPLAGAKIEINDGAGGVLANEDGRYSISLAKTEKIKMKISYLGYLTQEITFNPPKTGDKIDKSFQLVVEGVKSKEEVIISDSKYEKKIEEITISVQTLKPKAIDAQASTDLLKSMEQTSGVTVLKDQPNIRGSAGYTYGSGTRVLTMLDGLPMISADRSSAVFDMLPTDNIRQVEVIKGASSVLYGAGAMGGVINVLTSDPTSTPRSSVRIRHEVFDSPRNKAMNWDGRSSATNTSIHAFHARKIKDFDLTTQLDLIKNSGYKQEEFSNRGRALVMMKYHVPKVQGLYFGLNGQVNIDSSASFLAWGGYPSSLLIPGKGFLSYQFLQRYTLDPSISYLSKKGDRYVYRGRMFYQDNKINTGQSGNALLVYNEFQHIRNIITPKDSAGWSLIAIVGVNNSINKVKAVNTFGEATGNQYAAFAQLDLKKGRFNVSIGGRYQYEEMVGNKFQYVYDQNTGLLDTILRVGTEKVKTMNEPIFRAGANFRAHKATYIRASVGQGLRSPSVAERYTTTAAGGILVLPSPHIQLERGYTAEIGVKQMFKFKSFKGFIDASAFTMQFTNLVEFLFDRNAGVGLGANIPFSAQNINAASINGVEFNGYLETKAGNWIFSWGGGLTLIDPINKNGIKNIEVPADTVNHTPAQSIKFDGADDPFVVLFAGNYANNKDYSKIANDQPYTLKYRSKTVFRSSFEVGFKQISLMVNYRYNSYMVNVDKLFLIAIPGAKEFREAHKGSNVVDLIASYQIRKNTLSFHVFNVLNEEYALIPGSIGAQRSFCLQYKWNF